MKKLWVAILLMQVVWEAHAQSTPPKWTETDRAYHVGNLKRTRELVIKETENLTPAQWSFRESPDRWSIAQVVEHLGYWEIIFSRDNGSAIAIGKRDASIKNSLADTAQIDFIMEEKPHVSSNFSRPLGLMKGKDNLTFFLNFLDQHIEFVEKTDLDLRAYFRESPAGRYRDLYQGYIMNWGHIDRHLRQIKKIKANAGYPK